MCNSNTGTAHDQEPDNVRLTRLTYILCRTQTYYSSERVPFFAVCLEGRRIFLPKTWESFHERGRPKFWLETLVSMVSNVPWGTRATLSY